MRTEQLTHGIIYRGPSQIDGAPIVVVCVFREKGSNAKTGAMLQTYILPDTDLPIMEVMRLGLDVSVCGGCVHRYSYDANGVMIAGTRTCYVNLGQGVRVVLEGVQTSRYTDLSDNVAAIAELGADRMVRLGTWGDPAAVPAETWAQLLSCSLGHTGYTHQWRSERIAGDLAGVVMASCETADDVARAARKGFSGSFRVLPVGELPSPSAFCPASAEAGKIATCADCGRCNGLGGAVEIVAHGSMSGRYTGRKVLPTM
jgi:hypothetical protein